jgi:hypothetical protein
VTIPVPFPVSYSTLMVIAVKGESLGENCICPGCRIRGQLYFTGRLVNRGVIWHDDSGHIVFEIIEIPLSHCRNCRGRFRVLPAEILPFKIFSLKLIEEYSRTYLVPDADGPSLRKTVEGKPGDYPRPDFTTLHHWLMFLGEKSLGPLQPSAPSSPGVVPRSSSCIPWLPASALIAESAKRLRVGIKRDWTRPVEIPAGKYRNTHRREQLQACARLLFTADRLFPDEAHPLTAWEGKIIEYLNVAGWWFPSCYNCTESKLSLSQPDGLECPQASKNRKKEASNGPRAPPSGVFSF